MNYHLIIISVCVLFVSIWFFNCSTENFLVPIINSANKFIVNVVDSASLPKIDGSDYKGDFLQEMCDLRGPSQLCNSVIDQVQFPQNSENPTNFYEF